MGKKSRDKGAGFERWVARELRNTWKGTDRDYIRRLPQYQRGDVDPDVLHPVLWVECKRHKVVDLDAALAQADVHCPSNRLAIAIGKSDYRKVVCKMHAPDLMALAGVAGGEALAGVDVEFLFDEARPLFEEMRL